MKEKLAASLILLRVAFLPGLSVDKGGFPSGLETAESATAAGSPLSEITHKYRPSSRLMRPQSVIHSPLHKAEDSIALKHIESTSGADATL